MGPDPKRVSNLPPARTTSRLLSLIFGVWIRGNSCCSGFRLWISSTVGLSKDPLVYRDPSCSGARHRRFQHVCRVATPSDAIHTELGCTEPILIHSVIMAFFLDSLVWPAR